MDKTQMAATVIVAVTILLDILTGLAKGAAARDIDSAKMRSGLWHKSAYLIVIALAFTLEYGQRFVDMGFAVPLVVPVCVYVIGTETASVLENLVAINPELADNPLLGLFGRDGGGKPIDNGKDE